MQIETDTFRGRDRFKVIDGGKPIGFVRRAPNTKTRWLWVKGLGPVCSSKNYPSKNKAAEALVSYLEENPEPSPPKKLETVGPGRLFGPRKNRRNRRVRDRR